MKLKPGPRSCVAKPSCRLPVRAPAPARSRAYKRSQVAYSASLKLTAVEWEALNKELAADLLAAVQLLKRVAEMCEGLRAAIKARTAERVVRLEGKRR